MIESMTKFEDCRFLSMDGDNIIASYDGTVLRVSFETGKKDIELKGIQIDNWYERGNLRIKLDEDAIYVSKSTMGFPVNAVKYYKMD